MKNLEFYHVKCLILHEPAKFSTIKKLYAEHLLDFKGQYSSRDVLKSLRDLRYKLVELYLE